jgi:hypothetical protein
MCSEFTIIGEVNDNRPIYISICILLEISLKLKINTKALLQFLDNKTEWRGNAKQILHLKFNENSAYNSAQICSK